MYQDKTRQRMCECGCGELAPLASMTCASRGWVRGQPVRFIVGHNLSGTPPVVAVGERHGRLVVVALSPECRANRARRYECQCDCGNSTVVQGSYLKAGRIRSCGCLLDEAKRRRRPPIERFKEKIKLIPTPGHRTFCWIWTAYTNKQGYGKFQANDGGRSALAHVWSYEHYIGPVPKGKQLDHFKCWTPSCVNPRHVRPATALENTRNGKRNNATKTHCKYGHPFDSVNTEYLDMIARNGRPYVQRRCRKCKRIRDAERRQRIRQQQGGVEA